MEEKKTGWLKEAFTWVLTIVFAIVAAKLINHFVIIKAEVPTGSMENTIQVDDHILGFRLAYLFSAPERGDVVIFPYPDDPSVIYVKRIIGLPNETVEIKNGTVYIDGVALEEDYLKEEMRGSYGPYIVPEGGYFMLGDNRNSSADSRRWTNTFLKKEDIIAKVLFRYSPDFYWFPDTEYKEVIN